MRCLITGSAGYVGSLLVPALLRDGHEVVGLDIGWFGDGYIATAANYRRMQGDIRDLDIVRTAAKGCEAVIHLACVSNDHSCQLDEALSTSINFDAFEPLVIACKEAGVKRFIYCSSSSVYGVSDAPDVREDHPLVPLTLYNKYKGECEPLLRKHRSKGFECVILRPATVCGVAPRMRFDLTVNILTAHAVLKKVITVFGGEQLRPNLHIRDMVNCYRTVLTAPAWLVDGQTFNVGKQNMKVSAIASLVREVVLYSMGIDCKIETTESTDTRSYHVNSDRIRDRLGFVPFFSVQDAIIDLCREFKAGAWADALTNPIYTNVKQLVDKGFAVQDSLASYRKDRYPAAAERA